MKKISLLLILSFFVLTAFKNPDLIIGKWEIVKVVEENGKVMEYPRKWIELLADGRMEGGETDVPATLFGTWAYGDKHKTIKMTSDGEMTKDDGEYRIKKRGKLKKGELILSKGGLTVYLKKIVSQENK